MACMLGKKGVSEKQNASHLDEGVTCFFLDVPHITNK